jgi:class 3 adenylate cyclase
MLLTEWGEFSKKNIPLAGSISGEVFTSSIPLVIDKVTDHFKGVDKDTQKDTKSMICVPLTVTGQNLGVMQLLNKRTGNYLQRDLVLLEHFANIAAVAIRNAQLFKELMIHMGFNSLAHKGKGPLDFFHELEKPVCSEMITVVFIDMRGFTQLCQILNSPRSAHEHLREFLSLLTDEVISHNGMINKILGDGLLALFRNNNHELDAVRCAFSITNKFDLLKNRWNEKCNVDLNFLDIGLGIVTDSVIIGTISGEHFRDFTVIGNAVNLAAAFEKRAKAGKRILVDQITYTATKEYIAEIEGPVNFELRKDDQTSGHIYKQYNLKQLKSIKENPLNH